MKLVMKTLWPLSTKKERNYRKLKESIRMINSQRSDSEKIDLTEEGKNIGIDEVINNSLMSLI